MYHIIAHRIRQIGFQNHALKNCEDETFENQTK